MKVLDVSPFHDGLRQNIAMLDRLAGEMNAIEIAVKGLVTMDDSLKGQGGDAIRVFYNDCHLPFYATLRHLKVTLKEPSQKWMPHLMDWNQIQMGLSVKIF